MCKHGLSDSNMCGLCKGLPQESGDHQSQGSFGKHANPNEEHLDLTSKDHCYLLGRIVRHGTIRVHGSTITVPIFREEYKSWTGKVPDENWINEYVDTGNGPWSNEMHLYLPHSLSVKIKESGMVDRIRKTEDGVDSNPLVTKLFKIGFGLGTGHNIEEIKGNCEHEDSFNEGLTKKEGIFD